MNLTSASNEKSPKLIPYPNWNTNLYSSGNNRKNETTTNVTVTNKIGSFDETTRIISPFQIRVDNCYRLWVMDTGLVNILSDSKQVLPPALLIFDLNNDKLIRRYEFKTNDRKAGSFFANLVSEQE